MSAAYDEKTERWNIADLDKIIILKLKVVLKILKFKCKSGNNDMLTHI